MPPEIDEHSDENTRKQAANTSKLSVGARALTKHAHRSTEGFWGNPTGREDVKNSLANQKAEEIIRDCIWINLHILPHREYVIELRQL
jgi:hypothetical protein